MKNLLKINWYNVSDDKNPTPIPIRINASYAEYLKSTGHRVTKIKGEPRWNTP